VRNASLVVYFKSPPRLGDWGLGHISETFEGDLPHRPCGCIAPAWSVAEILQAYAEEDVKEILRAVEEPLIAS
jgi:glycogen debranching enzyme